MLRVLHVLDHSLPLHSGYAFRTRAIMTAQAAGGLKVRAVTGLRHKQDGPDPEQAEGLTFHRTRGSAGLAREWGEIAALAERIGELVEAWRPDVLHAHSPALCGMAALRAARRHKLPLVYEIRAFWEDAAVGNGSGSEGSLKYRLTRALENHVVGRADAVVTICNGLREDLVSRGIASDRISIMPNGVDLTLFGEPLPRDDALGEELQLGSGPVVGYIGSFYDYEGLDGLIEATPLLVSKQPEARLLLVGGGPVEAALRRQAAASAAAHAIRFVGRVPHADVERYYSLCDVMVYPRKASRLTDLVTPLKPLEAMAQGKLVAASAVGGHRELIQDGVTGTLFAPDDPDDCATSLARLLADRLDWPTIQAAARVHVADKHDWSRNALRYQDIYRALVSRRNAPLPAAA